MAFIHEHQIVTFEGFNGDLFITHLIAQLIYIDDFDGAARRALSLVEELRETEARQAQLLQMLTAQPFVGRKQDNLVGIYVAAPCLEVLQVLANIDVQQQSLAAAGGIPESNLVQVVHLEIAEGFRAFFGAVARHFFVQAIEQVLAVVEVPVQIQLGEQQREVLEVLHLQFVAFQLVALGSDGLPVRNNIQVVAPQVGLGHLVGIEQASGQFMEELGLAVLIDAFEAVVAKAHLERRKRAALKEAQHPAVEHQFLMEAALLCCGFWGRFILRRHRRPPDFSFAATNDQSHSEKVCLARCGIFQIRFQRAPWLSRW